MVLADDWHLLDHIGVTLGIPNYLAFQNTGLISRLYGIVHISNIAIFIIVQAVAKG